MTGPSVWRVKPGISSPAGTAVGAFTLTIGALAAWLHFMLWVYDSFECAALAAASASEPSCAQTLWIWLAAFLVVNLGGVIAYFSILEANSSAPCCAGRAHLLVTPRGVYLWLLLLAAMLAANGLVLFAADARWQWLAEWFTRV